MKKFIILALVLVLALSAFACGKPASLPENTSSPPIINNEGDDKTTPSAEPSPEPSETPGFVPEYPLFSDDYYAVIATGESQYAVYDCMGELVSKFTLPPFSSYDELCSLYPKDALVGGYDLEQLEFTCRTPENSYDYSNGIACIDYDALKLRAYDEEGNERYSVDFEFEPDDSDYPPYFSLGGILGFGENDIVFISSSNFSIWKENTVKPISPTIYSKSGKRIKTISEDKLGGALFGVLGEYLLIHPDNNPLYDGFRLVDINGRTIKEHVSAITSCQYFCDSELPIRIFEARYVCDSKGVVYDAQLKRCAKLERYTLESLSEYIPDDEIWPYAMFAFLTRCNPDGSIPGTVVYESEGISCVNFAALRNYEDGFGGYDYYDIAGESVCYGVNEDRNRWLIHTMQRDYFLSIDDPYTTLFCVNSEVAFFCLDSEAVCEMVSLETGETLLSVPYDLYSIGENLAVFRVDNYNSTPPRYAVYNNKGELLFETDAKRVVPTYDDKLIITRGSYTGIADMYGNWLLRGQKIEPWL